MKYILAVFKDGKTVYYPFIVGHYDHVANVAYHTVPGLMTHAVSFPHYLGHTGLGPEQGFDDIEDAHYRSGLASAQRRAPIIIKQGGLHA
ncbi:MAG: hypothetical protein ACI9T7_000053 [Oleiphilaceae bacterium]|jgi:hypothetical protein